MKYMLDTNICIYIIKKQPESVIKKLSLQNSEDICISAITLSELMYGVEKSLYPAKNKQALLSFLSTIKVLDFDNKASFSYGKIRAELEKQGMPIGSSDYFIAAHALSEGMTLVTNNTKEFKRVPDLKLENWV